MIIQKSMEKHKWAGLASIPVDEIVFHEVARIFARLPDPGLEALGKNIEEHGVTTPVLLNSMGQCIDGMNMALACMRMGIKEIPFETVDLDEAQLLDYVIGLNRHRLHLTEVQWAIGAVMLANRTHGGNRSKQQTCGLTQKEAATQFRVPERSVQSATFIQEHGVEELQDAVSQGEDEGVLRVTLADLQTLKVILDRKLPEDTSPEKLEACRAYARMINNLNYAHLEPWLRDDLTYELQWVPEVMCGKERYASYVRAELDAIQKSGSRVWAEIAYTDGFEAVPCVILAKKFKENWMTTLLLEMEGGKIRGMVKCLSPSPNECRRTGEQPR